MAITETEPLSRYEASRLVIRLRQFTAIGPDIIREILCDLPNADIDVIRGLLRIAKERIKNDAFV